VVDAAAGVLSASGIKTADKDICTSGTLCKEIDTQSEDW
jgi:hypothetical protein